MVHPQIACQSQRSPRRGTLRVAVSPCEVFSFLDNTFVGHLSPQPMSDRSCKIFHGRSKVVQRHHRSWWTILTTLIIKLILQLWYQETAQLLVNSLLSFSWQKRLYSILSWGLGATLHFLNVMVVLNPRDIHFLNYTKHCILSCLSQLNKKNGGHRNHFRVISTSSLIWGCFDRLCCCYGYLLRQRLLLLVHQWLAIYVIPIL